MFWGLVQQTTVRNKPEINLNSKCFEMLHIKLSVFSRLKVFPKRPPWHTCGRSSVPLTQPSRRKSECQHRSLTGRCKWLPSRGVYLVMLSCPPVSAPGQPSSCAFSHTLAFSPAWRVGVFLCQPERQMGWSFEKLKVEKIHQLKIIGSFQHLH